MGMWMVNDPVRSENRVLRLCQVWAVTSMCSLYILIFCIKNLMFPLPCYRSGMASFYIISIVSAALLMVIAVTSSPTWVQALGAGNHWTHAVDHTAILGTPVAKAACYYLTEGPQAVHSEKNSALFQLKKMGQKGSVGGCMQRHTLNFVGPLSESLGVRSEVRLMRVGCSNQHLSLTGFLYCCLWCPSLPHLFVKFNLCLQCIKIISSRIIVSWSFHFEVPYYPHLGLVLQKGKW